jgi:Zn-dependent M16 (insulinase) family peptidase
MATGARSLNAYMADRSFAEFQKERYEILQADPAAIRALAEPVEVVLKQGNLCVLGNEEKLAEEKELFDNLVPLVG